MHVDDVIRAYEVALRGVQPGETYNICSGNSYNIGEALRLLIDMSTADIRIEVDPDRVRPVDVPEIRGSHEKFTSETGWDPTIPFEQLLGDVLAYWRG